MPPFASRPVSGHEGDWARSLWSAPSRRISFRALSPLGRRRPGRGLRPLPVRRLRAEPPSGLYVAYAHRGESATDDETVVVRRFVRRVLQGWHEEEGWLENVHFLIGE